MIMKYNFLNLYAFFSVETFTLKHIHGCNISYEHHNLLKGIHHEIFTNFSYHFYIQFCWI